MKLRLKNLLLGICLCTVISCGDEGGEQEKPIIKKDKPEVSQEKPKKKNKPTGTNAEPPSAVAFSPVSNSFLTACQRSENAKAAKVILEKLQVSSCEDAAGKIDTLRYLSLSNSEIDRVEILEFLPNLRLVWLQNNPVLDLSPLSRVPKLELAWLEDSKAKTFPALKSLPRSNYVNWRFGENVCFGGWEYDEYNTCEHTSHGLKGYVRAISENCPFTVDVKYNRCRAKEHGYSDNEWEHYATRSKTFSSSISRKYVADDCLDFKKSYDKSIEDYERVTNFKQVFSERDVSTFRGKDTIYSVTCSFDIERKQYIKARSPHCGVESETKIHQECEHPSHGSIFHTKASAACGTSGSIKLSPPYKSRDEIAGAYGSPAGCSSCDDVLVKSSVDVSKKVECLQKYLQANPKEAVRDDLKSSAKLLFEVYKAEMNASEASTITLLME